MTIRTLDHWGPSWRLATTVPCSKIYTTTPSPSYTRNLAITFLSPFTLTLSFSHQSPGLGLYNTSFTSFPISPLCSHPGKILVTSILNTQALLIQNVRIA